MKKKQKKLIIEFSPEQTERYFEIVSGKTENEVNADCLPSGAQIVVDIAPPFGENATVNGIDIGGIDMQIVPV